jgi:hypothetical protein
VGEVCAFSVPADPIDVERNVIYHRGALEAVLRKLGYTPKPMLEGHSVVFSELVQQDYTGIGISCGGGMFNVCISYKSVPALTFATSRGGDWIDNNVAAAIGMPASLVCSVKESGVDLMNPKDRVQDAIVIYYRNLIQYTLETIKQKFETAQNMPTFNKPIDVVCAGGTSMIQGFIDVFRDEFQKINFPIEVNEIRLARDPLKAIARGCLMAALEEQRALRELQPEVAPAAIARSANVTTAKAEALTPRPLAAPPSPVRRDAPAQVQKAAPAPAPAPAAPRRDTARIVKAEPVRVPAPKPEPAKFGKTQAPTPAPAKKAEPPKPKPEPVLEEIAELEELQVEELDSEKGPENNGGDLPLIS